MHLTGINLTSLCLRQWDDKHEVSLCGKSLTLQGISFLEMALFPTILMELIFLLISGLPRYKTG